MIEKVMLNRLLLSIVLVVFLLLASRCKKEKKITECQGYVACPALFKDFFVFKDSSYWIYRDSVSGDLDSVWSSSYKKTDYWPYLEMGNNNTPCFEEYFFIINHSYNGISQSSKIKYAYQKNPINVERLTTSFRQTFSNNNSSQSRFGFTLKDSFLTFPDHGDGIVGVKSSIYVLNTQFKDIVYLIYNKPSTIDWVRNIYYAKNIGVIKYKDNYGRVWELLRYKVFQ